MLVSSCAWANHPLITDDTKVLGKGVWEFELHGESARRDGSQGLERPAQVLAKLGRGIGLKYGLNASADDRGVRAGIKLRW